VIRVPGRSSTGLVPAPFVAPVRRASVEIAPSGLLRVVLALAVLSSVVALGPTAVVGADPSPLPAAAPSCDELYPEEGPAGIDLRLGCLVDRLVAQYTGKAPSSGPARISAYLPALGAAVLAGAALVVLGAWVARRVGRRLAPVMPAAWWACPRCNSVNGAGTDRCYACGAPIPDEGRILPTAEHPETPQAFGGGRKPGGP
jgi:hypothetical protein